MFNTLKRTKKWFKASFEILFRGGVLFCQKYNSQISKNFEKLPKLRVNFNSLLKHAEGRLYEKQIYKPKNKGRVATQHYLITYHFDLSFH